MMLAKSVRCTDDDQRSVPSLDFIYSEDSEDESVMLLKRAIANPSDVQRCKNQICLTCNQAHREPTFVPCPRLNPSEIRQLPKRWWDYEEHVHYSLLEIISQTFANLFDHVLQPRECGCFCDSDSASTMSWLTGAYDEQGNWKPHASNPEEKIVESSAMEKAITLKPVSSSAENVPLLTPSSSTDSSQLVYIRECRITLTTTDDGDDYNNNADKFEAPFDEIY